MNPPLEDRHKALKQRVARQRLALRQLQRAHEASLKQHERDFSRWQLAEAALEKTRRQRDDSVSRVHALNLEIQDLRHQLRYDEVKAVGS